MATLYYDTNIGSDSYDGTSPTVDGGNVGPKLTFPTSISDGNTYSFARGSHFKLSGRMQLFPSTFTGLGLIFTAHGDRNKPRPIIDTLYYIATGDWGTVSSGVWPVDLSGLTPTLTAVERLFFDRKGQNGDATSVGTVTAASPFWFDTATDILYVYTGSDTINPTDFYGEVSFCAKTSNGGGGGYVMIFRSPQKTLVESLELRGGGTASISTILHADGDTYDGMTIRDVEITDYGDYAIWNFVANGVTDGSIGHNLKIQNCIIDDRWTELERSDTNSNEDGDAIQIIGMDGCIVEGNYISHSGHACMTLYATDDVGQDDVTQNIVVRRNFFTNPNGNYGRAIGFNGLDGKLNNVHFYQNWIHRVCVRNQFEGKDMYFYNNIVSDSYQSPLAANAALNLNQNLSVGERATAEVDNVQVFNNLFIGSDGCDESVIISNAVTGTGIESCDFRNNIVIKKDAGECLYRNINGPAGSYNHVRITNNCFYSTVTDQVINWDATVSDVQTAEENNYEMINNIQEDPMVLEQGEARFHLHPDSPCRGMGYTPLSTQDYNGMELLSPVADIGPIWYGPYKEDEQGEAYYRPPQLEAYAPDNTVAFTVVSIPVKDVSILHINNTAATVIAAFTGGYKGQQIFIYCEDGSTSFDFDGSETGSNVKGNGGTDLTVAAGDRILAVFDGTYWQCLHIDV